MCNHCTPKCDLYKILACDDRTAKQNMVCVGICACNRTPLMARPVQLHHSSALFQISRKFSIFIVLSIESGKGGTLFYIDQNLKYKVRGDLNIFIKSLIESTFIEIINTKQKNMMIGCIYKHPKLGTRDFNENYILPLMDKLSREKKDIPDHG